MITMQLFATSGVFLAVAMGLVVFAAHQRYVPDERKWYRKESVAWVPFVIAVVLALAGIWV